MLLLSLVVFLLILSVLVLIHEAGHYFVAKKLGIKVEEFGFGLPLTGAIFSIKRGETVYSFYPALIGGFVKLYGEDEAGAGRIEAPQKEMPKKELHRAFFSRSIGQRATVIVAGVLMNAVLAVVIYYVFLSLSNFTTDIGRLGDYHFFAVNQQVKTDVIISSVSKNSPAEKAHLAPFSNILSLNGKPVTKLNDFIDKVNSEKGKTVTLVWEDLQTGKKSTGELMPRINPPKGEGSLGVGLYPRDKYVLTYATPVQKIFSGITYPINLMAYQFNVLGSLIGISVKEKSVDSLRPAVSGPIGIGFIVGSLVSIPDLKTRVLQLLNLAGLLSISLAFVNVLPIPGLDGGRLFFIIIEAVFRKKVNPRIEGYIHAVGMSLLLFLVLLVTINDLSLHKDEIVGFFQQQLHH